ncbi:MAG TPA: hypothetical protein VNW92_08300 [Polyangiaceae bacterium]|jgi:hypothetical protein|nr:hypothetical protein [Polyangiaceae bacterium]
MTLNIGIGRAAIATAFGLAGLAHAAAARAVTCADVIAQNSLTHVIYGSGGSAITATLAKVAYTLSQASPPIIVFYADPGAQTGFEQFRDGKAGTAAAPFKYWITADALTAAAPPTCTAVDTIAGQVVDFGTTGGSLSLFGDTLPAGVAQFTGPAQGVNIIVPKDSTETSISTEALFFVYGFGDASQYTGASAPVPWTDPAYIIQRKSTSFVQQFIRGTIQTLGGTAANFPATFAGTQTAVHAADGKDSNQGTVDSVVYAASQGKAQNGIGFTSGPTADKNRATVHTLAYQHTGQNAGYWPDSTPDAFDKINIRTGQYDLWDVNLFFTKVTGSNVGATLDQISNADVKNFIGYFSGALAPPADADVNRAIVETGSIPLCAMHVQRDGDFGALSCYAPAVPCGCYFESITTKTATCAACTSDDQCSAGAPKCHFGFCEAY